MKKIYSVVAPQNNWKYNLLKFALINFAALISTMGITLFVNAVRLLPGGTTGLSFMFQSIFNQEKKLYVFWIIYTIINIPLVIFSYFKLGKRFSILSIVFVICQLLWGLLFSFIPQFNVIQNEFFNIFNINVADNFKDISYRTYFEPDSWKIFLPALFGGICYGSAVGICYLIGGSCGGSDIVNTWFARRYKKSIGSYILIFNIIIISLNVIIDMIWKKGLPFYRAFSSPVLIATIIFILVGSFMVNKIFPKHQKVQLQVVTTKAQEIGESLKKYEPISRFTILNAQGGYAGKEKKIILITISYMDLHKAIEVINKTDDKTFISLVNISGVSGNWVDNWY